MEEIIYFELDNWFCGRDYPNAEPFISWMGKDYGFCFGNDEWCKENKLCVEIGPIDMSTCICISAPKSWVEENCPKLLTDEECGSEFVTEHGDGNGNWIKETNMNHVSILNSYANQMKMDMCVVVLVIGHSVNIKKKILASTGIIGIGKIFQLMMMTRRKKNNAL